jgi:hypothetical protein
MIGPVLPGENLAAIRSIPVRLPTLASLPCLASPARILTIAHAARPKP